MRIHKRRPLLDYLDWLEEVDLRLNADIAYVETEPSVGYTFPRALAQRWQRAVAKAFDWRADYVVMANYDPPAGME